MFNGDSFAAAPDGPILAAATREDEALVVSPDLGEINASRWGWPFFAAPEELGHPRRGTLGMIARRQVLPALSSENHGDWSDGLLLRIQVDGVGIEVEEAGQGPVVLFLHAGIADRRMWDPQFTWLAASHRVVRWDARGHGETPHRPGRYSHAHDTIAIMDGLGIERATLVGCSMGGATAIRVARLHPERVDRLVLVGSAIHGFESRVPEPPIFREMEEAFRAGELDRILTLDEQAWVLGLGRRREDADPGFLALYREMNRASLDQAKVPAEAQDRLASDTDQIRGLRMPILAVTGAEDLAGVQEETDFIARSAPFVERVEIRHTAHLPSLERPQEFNRILGEWLAQHPVQA